MDFIMVFVIGIIFGSFFNVCIYRIAEGKSVIWPASHCPICKAKLKPIENVPIISYLVLKGKCGHCRTKISLQYPLIECITGLIFLMIYMKFGIGFLGLKFLVLCSMVLIAVVIDIKKMILPDRLTLGLVVVGYLFSLYPFSLVTPWGATLGAALFLFPFFLVYSFGEALYQKEVMGFGDLKLVAGIGCFFGFMNFTVIYLFFLYTFILGAFFGILAMIIGKKGRKTYLPFGPFIAVSMMIIMLQFVK